MGRQLGAFIKKEREKQDIAQDELATSLTITPFGHDDSIKPISKQFLSKIENGKAPLPYNLIESLCRELSIPILKIKKIMIKEYSEKFDKEIQTNIDVYNGEQLRDNY